MKTIIIYSFLILSLLLSRSIFGQEPVSYKDSVEFERGLELLNRPTRDNFDSQDKAELNFIFKKVDSIKQQELYIVRKFEKFITNEEMPFWIIYAMCDSLLSVYQTDLIIQTILDHEDIKRINTNSIRGYLNGDLLAEYPIRNFILEHSQIFIQYLIRIDYFSKEIPDKMIPISFKLFQNVLGDYETLAGCFWCGEFDFSRKFTRENFQKLNKFYNDIYKR